MTTDSKLCISQGVEVKASSIYLEEYSKPSEYKFLFCYKITITNKSDQKVKLLNRHWIIIDSNSKQEEVQGPGIVGQQPEIEPNESHEYLSFCNLETHFGTMEGSYEMEKADSSKFQAIIPQFYLADNLNQFDKPKYKRGQTIKHPQEDYRGIIADFDMYFINDEEIYNKSKYKPAKNKPWYYVLIDGTNAISYVAEEHLEPDEDPENIEHPLIEFFFNGFDGNKYIRNDKTWDELKRS
ncbi:MAG: Co2+/Mg2+ efflux protein ApaG [Candidatus Melainabacteria bacterium]|nr:Co2+/Mg2+ efflux protein ApaG [Candidatus Melainabacteria bacterium]